MARHDRQPQLIEGVEALAAYGGQSRMISDDGGRRFVEFRLPTPRLIIVGAVHVAQARAPMARIAGYEVVVVDPRLAFATDDRFPDTRLDPRWPDEALPGIGNLDRQLKAVNLGAIYPQHLTTNSRHPYCRTDCFPYGHQA